MEVPFLSTRMQRFFLCTVVFFGFAFAKAYAQSVTSQGTATVVLNSGITHVDITLNNHIALEIIAGTDSNYSVSNHQYGEYQRAVLLTANQVEKTLYITDPQNPSFTFPDNKLSAHKVVDGKATIRVPVNQTIFITAQSADIRVTGSFKDLTINLQNGSCNLVDTRGNINVVTVYAPVSIKSKNTKVVASSKNNKVSGIQQLKKYTYYASIETIYGSISIL